MSNKRQRGQRLQEPTAQPVVETTTVATTEANTEATSVVEQVEAVVVDATITMDSIPADSVQETAPDAPSEDLATDPAWEFVAQMEFLEALKAIAAEEEDQDYGIDDLPEPSEKKARGESVLTRVRRELNEDYMSRSKVFTFIRTKFASVKAILGDSANRHNLNKPLLNAILVGGQLKVMLFFETDRETLQRDKDGKLVGLKKTTTIAKMTACLLRAAQSPLHPDTVHMLINRMKAEKRLPKLFNLSDAECTALGIKRAQKRHKAPKSTKDPNLASDQPIRSATPAETPAPAETAAPAEA